MQKYKIDLLFYFSIIITKIKQSIIQTNTILRKNVANQTLFDSK